MAPIGRPGTLGFTAWGDSEAADGGMAPAAGQSPATNGEAAWSVSRVVSGGAFSLERAIRIALALSRVFVTLHFARTAICVLSVVAELRSLP